MGNGSWSYIPGDLNGDGFDEMVIPTSWLVPERIEVHQGAQSPADIHEMIEYQILANFLFFGD